MKIISPPSVILCMSLSDFWLTAGSWDILVPDTVIMHKRAMVELDTAIKVSVDGKKLFDMSKDLVWDSLQLPDNPSTDNIGRCRDSIHTFCV